ncbi:MAG: hypothetical protein II563_02600, partial [Treponema sp.]|nr:hypothetical protein [Treponema sp.]
MNSTFQNAADVFLRTYADKFSIRDMLKFFSSAGIKTTAQECQAYLDESPWVFALESGAYVTKAAAFTGEIFSIRPTAQEFEQGVLVPGSRCIPFVDSEVLSSSLVFFINGKRIPKKVGTFDSDTAIDMFQLYGEEYAPQYIASDPANKNLDMVSREFDLPNNVRLTGLDMRIFIEDYGMQLGDRILCSVLNWDKGFLQAMVVRDGKNKFNRGIDGSAKIMWYAKLEESLLESFDRMGPCDSMESQLANVFFENSRDLCGSLCGSVEEYLNGYANKVGFCHFGVETRLWFKGQDVPSIGKWNSSGFEEKRHHKSALPYGVSQDVLEQYIYDMIFSRSTDFDKLIEKIYPDDYVFHKDEKSYILEVLKDFYVSIKGKYNWFSDVAVGEIRSTALDLFSDVSGLIYKIDTNADDVKALPQQELVILTQLYGHLFRIIRSLGDTDA